MNCLFDLSEGVVIHTRPGDFNSVGGWWDDGSEPADDAEDDDDDGETPDDVVRTPDVLLAGFPFVEKDLTSVEKFFVVSWLGNGLTSGENDLASVGNDFTSGEKVLASVDDDEVGVRIPGAPPKPPRVLEYVSSSDISPEPWCKEP